MEGSDGRLISQRNHGLFLMVLITLTKRGNPLRVPVRQRNCHDRAVAEHGMAVIGEVPAAFMGMFGSDAIMRRGLGLRQGRPHSLQRQRKQ